MSSEDARRCFSRHWLRFLKTVLETADDECTIEHSFTHFESTGRNIRELVLSLVTSDAFTLRRVEGARSGSDLEGAGK